MFCNELLYGAKDLLKFKATEIFSIVFAVVEPVVAAPAAMPTEAEILAIIQPKLDEIYKMIADLKAEHAGMMMPEVEVELTKTKMSIHDRFSQVMKISKEN